MQLCVRGLAKFRIDGTCLGDHGCAPVLAQGFAQEVDGDVLERLAKEEGDAGEDEDVRHRHQGVGNLQCMSILESKRNWPRNHMIAGFYLCVILSAKRNPP